MANIKIDFFMNYSRFATSVWQTFWSAESDNIYRENQIFEICDIENISFTYAEIRYSIDDCLEKVKLHYTLEKEHIVKSNYYVDKFGELCFFEKKIRRKPTKISESHLRELRGYMEEFIRDVESEDSLY